MQLAYELLPVMAGQDENLPTAISHLRHRSRVYLKRRQSHVVRRTPKPIRRRRRSSVERRALTPIPECRTSSVLQAIQSISSTLYPYDARRATQDVQRGTVINRINSFGRARMYGPYEMR